MRQGYVVLLGKADSAETDRVKSPKHEEIDPHFGELSRETGEIARGREVGPEGPRPDNYYYESV
jgi:hypothetical protein